MQMAAEMLLERDELSLVEFRNLALECGHRGITCLATEMAEKTPSNTMVEEDGI